MRDKISKIIEVNDVDKTLCSARCNMIIVTTVGYRCDFFNRSLNHRDSGNGDTNPIRTDLCIEFAVGDREDVPR